MSDLPRVAAESRPRTHGLQEPAHVGEALQAGADHAHELLCARLDILGKQLPQPGDKVAAARAIMLRDSIDAAARDASDVARSILRSADLIAYTARTQNKRRRQIVPATPSCLRLKEAAFRTVKALDGCCAEAWTRDDESSKELVPVLEKIFRPGHTERFLAGRPSLLGAGSATVQVGQILVALQRLESLWGSFDIWVQRPGFATCQSLIRAWERGEADFEDYLTWFCKHELRCDVDPTRDDFNRWCAYVAQALLGMRVSRGKVHLRTDMPGLVDLPEQDILRRISAMAWARKAADENGKNDLIRIGRSRCFDALDQSDFLEEIDDLFSSEQMNHQTVMGTAVLEALTREDFERIGRKAGLTKEQSRFMAKWFWGRAQERDNPGARIAIRRCQDAIIAAMQNDPKFAWLSGWR